MLPVNCISYAYFMRNMHYPRGYIISLGNEGKKRRLLAQSWFAEETVVAQETRRFVSFHDEREKERRGGRGGSLMRGEWLPMNVLIFNVKTQQHVKIVGSAEGRDSRSDLKWLLGDIGGIFLSRESRSEGESKTRIYYPDEPKTSDPTATTTLRRQAINFLSKDAIQVQWNDETRYRRALLPRCGNPKENTI